MPLVGRVSAVAGTTQYHATTGEWSAALVNEPVAAGTSLRTTTDAEAEWRSPGARIALAPASMAQVLRFDGDTLQIAVIAGRVGIHLNRIGAAKTVEIDLPQGGVWLDAPGDYDITAGDEHSSPTIEVFAGNARLGGGLDDDQIAAATPDWLSDWWRSQGEEAPEDRGQLANVSGAAALEADGRWETDPQLGRVWYPSGVAADWSPYRDGAWRFLAPWGWTWIDNEPWGFAPSHYGRWARIDDRWGWVPGEQLSAANYSSAVVAFVGTAGIGLSRPGDLGTAPAIAWFPLAPGETIGDGNDPTYQNRPFTTAVPRAVFAAGAPVGAALIDDIPERRFANAPVILGAIDIPPTMVVAVAARKPAISLAAASPPPRPAPMATARRPVVLALRVAPTRDAGPKRTRVAAFIVRSRAMGSTGAFHPAHNRQHLAAARGGA